MQCNDRAKNSFIFTLLFEFRRVTRWIFISDVWEKQITRFLTPAISIAIIIWGFYLGLSGVGRYYVGLGVFSSDARSHALLAFTNVI